MRRSRFIAPVTLCAALAGCGDQPVDCQQSPSDPQCTQDQSGYYYDGASNSYYYHYHGSSNRIYVGGTRPTGVGDAVPAPPAASGVEDAGRASFGGFGETGEAVVGHGFGGGE